MYKHIYCVNPTNVINIYKEHNLSNRIWKRGMKKFTIDSNIMKKFTFDGTCRNYLKQPNLQALK